MPSIGKCTIILCICKQEKTACSEIMTQNWLEGTSHFRGVEVWGMCTLELMTHGVLVSKGHLQSHHRWQCFPHGQTPHWPREASERFPLRCSHVGPSREYSEKSSCDVDMVSVRNMALIETLFLQQKTGDFHRKTFEFKSTRICPMTKPQNVDKASGLPRFCGSWLHNVNVSVEWFKLIL